MTMDEQIELLLKGTVDCIPGYELRGKLEHAARTGTKLRVKAGFDPTAPDLHLGHTVVIRKMRHFQMLGHQVIFLIGDFTAMIGDPSGRSATRPQLSKQEIEANAETFKKQISKLLDMEMTEIRFNSEWMSAFSAEDFLRLTGRATVAQMLERDDFAKRFNTCTPISLHEFVYPLVQGYDSVALESDVELGGTDQRFNLLMARQIQRDYGIEAAQVIMTTPLLVGTDGVQKMSKSLNNYIGITEPPRDMFGKIMSISDDLMWRYYDLLTDLSGREIQEIKESGQNPRNAKAQLARMIIADFHSAEKAQEASMEFDRIFSERELPTEIPTAARPAGEIRLARLLAEVSLATSIAEAQRLIQQGSVRVDRSKVENVRYEITGAADSEVLLQVGKRKFLMVRFS